MNLVDVYPSTPVFIAACSGCGGRTQSDRGMVADLDDKPGTYYCRGCAATRRYIYEDETCDTATQ
jgi:hypothetical protein